MADKTLKFQTSQETKVSTGAGFGSQDESISELQSSLQKHDTDYDRKVCCNKRAQYTNIAFGL